MDKEEIVLATIYKRNGNIGISYTDDSNRYEVLYFLESYCLVERTDYETTFNIGK